MTPNQLVRFDPRDASFARWPIPGGGVVVRNMVATSGDRLFLAESGVDKIAIADTRPMTASARNIAHTVH